MQSIDPSTHSPEQWFNGILLAQIRKKRGLTQKAVSEKTGLSRNQIIAMEKGLFTGGLKYLHRYLCFLNLKLQLVEEQKSYPQFEELSELFKEEDE